MPVQENSRWRTVLNMIQLDLHQISSADFIWSGRNTFAFNRCFFVREGTGSVRNHSTGELHNLRRGGALFMPESADLSFEFRDGLKFLCCHFNLHILPGVDIFQKERHCREFAADPVEIERMERMTLAPPDWFGICDFEMFLWRVIRALPLPPGDTLAELANLSGRYGGLLRYIQENLSAQMGVEELAEVAGQSRGTLSRNFSHDLSIPLKSFLQKELIAQTSRYLLCSPLSIREIAEHFRFSSEYYFSNFFKRHTGTTPSAFRKANLHAHSLPL